jgi:hypothetical protein
MAQPVRRASLAQAGLTSGWQPQPPATFFVSANAERQVILKNERTRKCDDCGHHVLELLGSHERRALLPLLRKDSTFAGWQ